VTSVFDIDGCLADTLPIVRRSYFAAAGVLPSEDDVRKNWRLWLPDLVGGMHNAERVHERKNVFYADILARHGVRQLPAGTLARELAATGERVMAVTAGSWIAASAVLMALDLDIDLLGTEVFPESRPELLDDVAPTGTYYDDDLETCYRVHAETSWSAIPV
jgi:hypothetical protein